MPFQYVLANLLAESSNAVAVMFMDDAGETVELATSEYTPFDVQVVGAYLGIYLRQTHAAFDAAGLGPPEAMHIQHRYLHIHLRPLPEGYFLALVHRGGGPVARDRQRVERAAGQLTAELFEA
jgi:hypothetical protein